MGNLLTVWSTIGSVALAILILLVMITIHEFGHFLAGKILKFKIDEFSVGFGPALLKLEFETSGEVFALRLIPLGGYCAFHGEDGLDDPAPAKEDSCPPPASGGGVGVGVRPEPSATEEEGVHVELTAPADEGAEEVETELPLGGDDEGATSCPPPAEGRGDITSCPPPASGGGVGEGVRPESPDPPKRNWTDDGDFTHMKPWKRIIVLVAGATMNYILALFLILIEFFSFGQSVIEVRGVAPSDTWGTELSLQAGDYLLGAEGHDFYLTTDIASAINHRAEGDRVQFTVSRLREDGTRREENVTIVLRTAVEVKNSADFNGVWSALGIDVETREDGRYYMLGTASHRLGFGATLGHSFVYSWRLAGSIFKVIGELLTGRLGLNALGGPVTTITLTSQIASQGVRDFLEISALIGVNLAVFNLLPIPALDGSKVVFTAIEWVRGRPISRKIEAVIHAVGFVLLIGFAILVDVLQFV